MLIVEVLAYGGCLLEMWLLGRQDNRGNVVGILLCIPWTILVVHAGLYLMVAFEAILTLLSLRAYLIWRLPRNNC